MTEHQRRNQQTEASFGDELSRVGPRIIDWAVIATPGNTDTSAPRVSVEGFRAATLPISRWSTDAAAYAVGIHAVPRFVLRGLHSLSGRPATPIRGGVIGSVTGTTPRWSVALGVGGRNSWSLDWETSGLAGGGVLGIGLQQLEHTTVQVASPNRSFAATVRSQGPTTSFHFFKSIGRAPLWHTPVPTSGELEATAETRIGRLRERWRQRNEASARLQRRLWGPAAQRLDEARVPFVRVGAGLTVRRGPIPGAMPFCGLAAELTNRTSIAFHTDVLHRTCTTLTSFLSERLAAAVRLRCNLITFAETTLDLGVEYRIPLRALPPKPTWKGPVTPASLATAQAAAAATAVVDAAGAPTTLLVRGSFVYDRVAIGVSSEDALMAAGRLLGLKSASSRHIDALSQRLVAAAQEVGPVRLTLGVEALIPEEDTVGRRWTLANMAPRLILSIAM